MFRGDVKFRRIAEKRIYLLRYLPELQDIPAELAQEPYTHAFAIAEERWLYEGSLKQARTFYAELAAAEQEGRRKQAVEIAQTMLSQGFAISLIAQMTGLTEAEVGSLQG